MRFHATFRGCQLHFTRDGYRFNQYFRVVFFINRFYYKVSELVFHRCVLYRENLVKGVAPVLGDTVEQRFFDPFGQLFLVLDLLLLSFLFSRLFRFLRRLGRLCR